MIPTEPPFEHMLGKEMERMTDYESREVGIRGEMALEALEERYARLLAVARAAKIVEKMAEYDLEHDRPGYYIHSDDFHWLVVALAAVEDLLMKGEDKAFSSIRISRAAQYPAIYDAEGNKIEIEVRCAVCLYGLCEDAVAVKLKKRKGMWGIFGPLCKTCRLDIEQGRQPTVRHDRRQIDILENGDYEGFEFE